MCVCVCVCVCVWVGVHGYFEHLGSFKVYTGGASGKESACRCRRTETWVRSLGWEDPLEEGMATHSSMLVWRIPWTEEPGGPQSMGSQKIRHD